MKSLIVVTATLIVVLTATFAMAATATNSLTAAASVVTMCRITSVTNLDFGTYDPTDSANDDDGVGNMAFRCTRGTNYDVYITGARTMTDGTDTLNFQLYQEAGRTTAWPSGAPGVSGVSANNAPVSSGIYGRIPALQDVQAGSYAGTVTVTINY